MSTSTQTSRTYCQNYLTETRRYLLNGPSWLLVFYSVAVGMCLQIGVDIPVSLATPVDHSCWEPIPHSKDTQSYLLTTVQSSIFWILFPIMGWLSDSIIGRHRSISLSLLFSWFGIVLTTISYCIQNSTCGLPVSIAKYGFLTIALLLLMIGTAGFLTNILAYGLEQLIGFSTIQIRAYIHWIVWGLFLGFTLGYIANAQALADVLPISCLFASLILSIVLCVNIYFRHLFTPVGVISKNPYRLVVSVLIYALKNKHINRRSALTYWEAEPPSRLDLGKDIYGGPFLEVDVEAVKAFFRIVLIFFCLFGFYIPYYIGVEYGLPYINIYKGSTTALHGYGSYVLWGCFDSLILLLVPLFQLFIIPLWPKLEYFILSPIRGLGLTYGLILLMLLSSVTINIIGHVTEQHTTSCFSSESVNISFLYYSIPFFFIGLADSLSYIYGLEFICSQAPVHMSGMLTGVFFLIRGLFSNSSIFIQILFQANLFHGPGKLTCSFWLLLVYLIICVIGFLVFIKAVKWYRNRTYGYFYDINAVVEATYDNYFQQRDQLKNSSSFSMSY